MVWVQPGLAAYADPQAISLIVTTTDFAATAGAISAMFISYFHTKKWDVSMGMIGCLGGLVAITAPCAFVTPGAALLIGVITGAITYYGVILMEKLRINDPVSEFPVIGMNGMFGVLAVSIWGVDGFGLLSGGGFTQLGTQAIGILAAIVFVFPIAYLMFQAIDKTIGLRVKPEIESVVIDLEYHGIESYPEFTGVKLHGVTISSVPTSQKGVR